MKTVIFSLLQRLCLVATMSFATVTVAQAQPNAYGAPDKFVLEAANGAITALKDQAKIKAGNLARINQIVNQYILPYVDFRKTTQLSAGRYWRQATAEQKTALADAFRGTLVRTYSGALTDVTASTEIKLLPFRGDPNADDVVVRSLITQSNGQPIAVDYRLEKTPQQGWRIYDINVEGIWLIQNYRNQFAQQIEQSGIDGLIKALSQRNQ